MDDKELEGLVYEKTPERERILLGLELLEKVTVAFADTIADTNDKHRVCNVAQSVASQKSLLEQDWSLAGGGSHQPIEKRDS